MVEFIVAAGAEYVKFIGELVLIAGTRNITRKRTSFYSANKKRKKNWREAINLRNIVYADSLENTLSAFDVLPRTIILVQTNSSKLIVNSLNLFDVASVRLFHCSSIKWLLDGCNEGLTREEGIVLSRGTRRRFLFSLFFFLFSAGVESSA